MNIKELKPLKIYSNNPNEKPEEFSGEKRLSLSIGAKGNVVMQIEGESIYINEDQAASILKWFNFYLICEKLYTVYSYDKKYLDISRELNKPDSETLERWMCTGELSFVFTTNSIEKVKKYIDKQNLTEGRVWYNNKEEKFNTV